ncbi:MAG: DUF3604 domain-containing protein [Fimbriimonadaceae bacterium]|nr:DUF3604 domain-containing protein [Fimbriimonadaceae bacterium]
MPLHWSVFTVALVLTAASAEPLAQGSGTPAPQCYEAGTKVGEFTVSAKFTIRLPAGGMVRVLTPREGGWTKPSPDPSKEEAKFGWSTPTWELQAATGGVTLEPFYEKWSDRGPPYTAQDVVRCLRLVVGGNALEPGDQLTVRFPNVTVSRTALFADPAANASGYRLQTQLPGSTEWVEVPGLPQYAIAAAAPFQVRLRGTTQAVVGEPARFATTVLDRFGNPAPGFAGDLLASCSDARAELPAKLTLRATDAGKSALPVVFTSAGRQTVTLRADRALEGLAADTLTLEVLPTAPPLRAWWGELHNHGVLSYDARNWGGCRMRPRDQFAWARDVNGLDFCAVTDHAMHSGNLRQQNMTAAEFAEVQAASRELLQPGRFVTFTACEQRCARGDTNAYYLGDADPFYMAAGPITIQQFWKLYRPGDVVTIPHLHPMNKNAARFDEIDATKERAIEIHSNHGRYEYHENQPLLPGKGMVPGNNVQAILARGHRLGLVAASDDHSGRAGNFDLTAVLAPRLERDELFKAIQARHTWCTTGPRVNLRFSLGEAIMGDELRLPPGDPRWTTRRFRAAVETTVPLTALELVRNGKVIYSTAPGGPRGEFEFADTTPLAECWLGTEVGNPPTCYYYLRATQQPAGASGQQNLHMAWSSPIYLSPAAG